eukprot:Sro8_g006650.3  (975) ;mRNA; r:87536-90697
MLSASLTSWETDWGNYTNYDYITNNATNSTANLTETGTNATLPEDYDLAVAESVTTTYWEAKLQCVGCPDHEPLFDTEEGSLLSINPSRKLHAQQQRFLREFDLSEFFALFAASFSYNLAPLLQANDIIALNITIVRDYDKQEIRVVAGKALAAQGDESVQGGTVVLVVELDQIIDASAEVEENGGTLVAPFVGSGLLEIQECIVTGTTAESSPSQSSFCSAVIQAAEASGATPETVLDCAGSPTSSEECQRLLPGLLLEVSEDASNGSDEDGRSESGSGSEGVPGSINAANPGGAEQLDSLALTPTTTFQNPGPLTPTTTAAAPVDSPLPAMDTSPTAVLSSSDSSTPDSPPPFATPVTEASALPPSSPMTAPANPTSDTASQTQDQPGPGNPTSATVPTRPASPLASAPGSPPYTTASEENTAPSNVALPPSAVMVHASAASPAFAGSPSNQIGLPTSISASRESPPAAIIGAGPKADNPSALSPSAPSFPAAPSIIGADSSTLSGITPTDIPVITPSPPSPSGAQSGPIDVSPAPLLGAPITANAPSSPTALSLSPHNAVPVTALTPTVVPGESENKGVEDTPNPGALAESRSFSPTNERTISGEPTTTSDSTANLPQNPEISSTSPTPTTRLPTVTPGSPSLTPTTASPIGSVPTVTPGTPSVSPSTGTPTTGLPTVTPGSPSLTPTTASPVGFLPTATPGSPSTNPITGSPTTGIPTVTSGSPSLTPTTTSPVGLVPTVTPGSPSVSTTTTTTPTTSLPTVAPGSPSLTPTTANTVASVPSVSPGSPSSSPTTATPTTGIPTVTPGSPSITPTTASPVGSVPTVMPGSPSTSPTMGSPTTGTPTVTPGSPSLTPTTASPDGSVPTVMPGSPSVSPSTGSPTTGTPTETPGSPSLAPTTASPVGSVPTVTPGSPSASPTTGSPTTGTPTVTPGSPSLAPTTASPVVRTHSDSCSPVSVQVLAAPQPEHLQ